MFAYCTRNPFIASGTEAVLVRDLCMDEDQKARYYILADRMIILQSRLRGYPLKWLWYHAWPGKRFLWRVPGYAPASYWRTRAELRAATKELQQLVEYAARYPRGATWRQPTSWDNWGDPLVQ